MALTDCARLRLKYMTRRNDIEFARENRIFFEDLPPDAELSDLGERYSRVVSLVQLHAQKIAGRKIAPTVFDLSSADPNLDLPVVNFRRVNVAADIPVPQLIGQSYDFARGQLLASGLESEGELEGSRCGLWGNPRYRTGTAASHRNIGTAQDTRTSHLQLCRVRSFPVAGPGRPGRGRAFGPLSWFRMLSHVRHSRGQSRFTARRVSIRGEN